VIFLSFHISCLLRAQVRLCSSSIYQYYRLLLRSVTHFNYVLSVFIRSVTHFSDVLPVSISMLLFRSITHFSYNMFLQYLLVGCCSEVLHISVTVCSSSINQYAVVEKCYTFQLQYVPPVSISRLLLRSVLTNMQR